MILLITLGLMILTFIIIIAIENKGKKNNIKTLDGIKKYRLVITLILIDTVINFALLYSIPYIRNIVLNDNIMRLDDILIILLVSLTISMNIVGILMIWIQPIYEKKTITKLEKGYKKNNFEYYRDLLGNIPPAIMAYCYDNNINIPDVTVAIFLNLQRKKIIEIGNDKIKILNNINSYHEKELFRLLPNIDEVTSKEKFMNNLFTDMKEQCYLYDGDKNKMNITIVIEYFIAFMIIYGIILLFGISFITKQYRPKLSLLIFVAYFLSFVSLPIVKYVQSKISSNFKTDKGIELSAKVHGLKNFLNTFTNISNMEIKDINLYDDYIIYAIIFNMSGKLNKECHELYNKLKKMPFYINDD